MATAHFKIVIRKDRPKKDGQYPVCLRATIDRKSKLFPLNFDCIEKDFDAVKEIVKKTDIAHYRKNLLIQKENNKAGQIKFDYAIADKNLTLTEFDRVYKNDNYGSVSFYEYIEYLIKKREATLAPDTIEFYKKQLSKLRRFCPSLTFGEVTEEFLYSYRDYMINDLSNKLITQYKCLEFIKRVFNQAWKEDKIKTNPFKNFPIKRLKGTTEHLTLTELASLSKLYNECTLSKSQQNVLSYFLFSCFTGLRYGDVYGLKYNSIKTVQEIHLLDFVQHKTSKPIVIPLIKQAFELIAENGLQNQKVFNVLVNQKTNFHLKEIMKKAVINKRITFHSARHTCSNVLYGLGVPLELRCMIIGDTKEVVTGHYTQENINLKLEALLKIESGVKALMKPI